MALTQKHRSSIYQSLTPLLGEEEAEAMLAQFPATEADQPLTRDHLHAELIGIRSEMAELGHRLDARIDELDHRLSTQIAELDHRLTAEIAAVEARLTVALHEALHEAVRTIMVTMISSLVAILVTVLGAAIALH